MTTLKSRITWERCGTCGGQLPLIDGDNGTRPAIAALLPRSRGDCPGARNSGGHCGAYSVVAVDEWMAEIDAAHAASTLGKRGGAAKSPAKTAAARQNATKGGRPRRLRGSDAIAYADEHGLTLNKHTDPTEDARTGLTVGEARAVAAEDPSLIWIDVPRAERGAK